MIILDATTKSLQIKLSATVTTNQLPFSASYVDSTGTTSTPGENDGTSNNTTAVTVVGSPASSTQRLVKNIVIQNADTVNATVTVIYNNNSTLRNIIVATLSAGDQLIYEDGSGWSAVNSTANLKTSSSGGGSGVSQVTNSDGTLTISPTTGNVVASLAPLTSAKFLVGNGSNVATGVSMSGDATLANTGAVTIANNAVTNSKAAQMAANTLKGNNTGSTANAADLTVAQVLAMLNISASTITYNAIAGLLPTSISGTNTTAAVTISSGQATDSTNVSALSLSSNTSWAVSNGNAINGYQGGTTLSNSSTIHFFLCSGGSGTGTFASTSLTPTLPTGYATYYRRIFSLNTNSSGALLGGTPIETEGGSMLFWLGTQALDIRTTSTTSTSRTLYTLPSVPAGIKMQPIGRFLTDTNSAGDEIILTSPDETDVAPSGSYATTPCWDIQAVGGANANMVTMPLTTNTSGQIGVRVATASTSISWVTRGFKDFRRS